MIYTIQNLVLPVDAKHKACRKLFYRGDRGIVSEKKNRLTLGFAQHCDFTTYLNACSWQKWQKYTHANNVALHLFIRGDARITLVGYHKDAFSVDRQEFYTKKIHHETCQEVILPFPENNQQIIGFEIAVLSPKVIISRGFYTTEIDEKTLNPVQLHLATTTCKKEFYIKKNLRLLQREIFDKNDEVAQNLTVQVVDNGQTLTKNDLPSEHFVLHPNLNTGGSGGFARGMIEAVRSGATHVLLMDDDVLVLPESIRRTYNLLRLGRPEYRDYFINGAMLYYENPECQCEDVGLLKPDGSFGPLKGEFNHRYLRENLQNEQEYPAQAGTYGAWWYCCVPTKIIRQFGLPLPLFIRGDDIEYSIRCQAKFITMNGICIWHLGFASKHSNLLKYQEHRNQFIMQAIDQNLSPASVLNRNYNAYRQEMLRFNYEGAYAYIRAFVDFCKGPDFIKNITGPELIAEFAQYDHQLQPLDELDVDHSFQMEELWHGKPMRLKTRLFLKLTWNGQQYWPARLKDRGTNQVIYDGDFLPERVAYYSKLLAVEPFLMKGVFHTRDRQKFRELKHLYEETTKYYHRNRQQIIQNWQSASAELTSPEFWRQHLQLK